MVGIEVEQPLKLMELLKACSIHLVYVGKLRFGSLRWRAKPTPPPNTISSVQFKIVEEYTLDNATASNLITPKNNQNM